MYLFSLRFFSLLVVAVVAVVVFLVVVVATENAASQAVALLAEMPSRHVTPDVVCFGAAIGALSEGAGTQNRSAWGAKSGDRGKKHEGGAADAGGDGDGAGAVAAKRGPPVATTRAHEKAVALIQEMRRSGPR